MLSGGLREPSEGGWLEFRADERHDGGRARRPRARPRIERSGTTSERPQIHRGPRPRNRIPGYRCSARLAPAPARSFAYFPSAQRLFFPLFRSYDAGA